jgi:hypothetical protein
MSNVKKPRRAKAKKARAPRARAKARQVASDEAAKSGEGQDERGFLFDDPYWDDAFCAYHDPTLGTCCHT